MSISTLGSTVWQYNGYIQGIGNAFDEGVLDLNEQLLAATDKLESNPSDPVCLADYQKAMSEYNLYRNAQTSAVKAMKDIDSSIVSNFR